MRTFLFALLLLSLCSCNLFGGKRVRGNGNVTTRSITASAFENVDASGEVTVFLQQGAAAAVQVETDENLLEYLEVTTEGNTLKIRPKNGYSLNPSKELIVRVTAPRFDELEISGASKLLGQNALTGDRVRLSASGASEIQLDVDVKTVEADLSGACTLKLRGKTEEFSSEASGASNILCFDLAAERARLDLSGSSNAKVTANKELEVDASGASDVQYRGNPSVNQKSSGASSVKKIS